MEDFSDLCHHPFLIDSTFLPNIINSDPPSHEFHFHQETSFVDQSSKIAISDNNDPSSVTKNQSPETSMVVDNKLENDVQVTEKVTPMDKNKKRRTGIESSSLSSPQSKDSSSEGRNKKQRAGNGGQKEKDKPNAEKKEQKNGPQEPPTGYIHVRARRGQATDSHSLAERVRREKISERMKMLQKLVPGCDKVQEVTGKALVLDEIINYVQSLQNQVEFLSMKLASVNPMFYDLAMDIDTLLVRPEKLYGIASPSPSPPAFMPQCSSLLNQATTSADTISFPAANDYNLLDNSSLVFLQEQMSINAFSEDIGTMFWDLEDQRQKFLHAYGFGDSFCSLH